MKANTIEAMCHEAAQKVIERWSSRNSPPLGFLAKLDLALCMTDEFGEVVKDLDPYFGDIDLEEVRDLLEQALAILR